MNWRGALTKFTVKPVEIPESNKERRNEGVSYLKVVALTECWLDFQLFNAGIRIGLIVAFYPLSSSWVWIALTGLMFTLDINSVIVCSRHVPPLHHDHIRHNYVRDFLRSPRLISCHKTDHILPNGVKKLFFFISFFCNVDHICNSALH